ncbi:hypothetical protein B0I31_101281 [Saccharothrix carnea]|uniref:Uncharacterized protein n=1 Tax=Saccharothrix carnea TaxID=1280637 RepID=A0A2P8IHW4_SACCR|nr:hypothetical protein [Saccharothrix carnea]PSL58066.1 hypothetical protein B0I31_101281 [Saccharothrix carnea]
MIALIGALVGLRAGYRYDRSIGRHPLRSGVKRLVFWALLFVAECLVVPQLAVAVGPVVVLVVFAYVMAVGLAGPWVSEYYRRRAA